MTALNKQTLRYGDNVLWFLNELAAYDASDIDGGEFDVYGEDRNGLEGCATIDVTELAADAAKLIEAAEKRIAEQSDYFSALVAAARKSADKAMRKYPQPNYVLLKVAEEAGEVVRAGVHYAENRMTWDEVEGEIVQLLAMLIRLVTEGDQINGVTPPQSVRAAGIVLKGE